MSQLVRIGMFLFDEHRDELADDHVEKMIKADNKDKEEKNRKRTALRIISSAPPTPSNHCVLGNTTTVSLRLMGMELLIMIQLWST
jgi:hypothetical protein